MEMPPEKANEPTFFVDAMLGNIAKKLRLMGYDSMYFSSINDDELIQLAKNDKRIIISRDEDLVRKSIKNGIKLILTKNSTEIEQFRDMIKKSNLKIIEINGDRARCPNCNSKTQSIDKKNILQKIPIKVLEYNDRFWECKSCNQIFWEGTYIKNLQKFVGELNER
jgi:uncharacterized protein with PIN domain